MSDTKIPTTLQALFDQVTEKGGEVIREGSADLWLVSLPRRFQDGVRQVNVCHVGFYVRDGRARISSGIHQVRRALAN
jgi:hypothetical protein